MGHAYFLVIPTMNHYCGCMDFLTEVCCNTITNLLHVSVLLLLGFLVHFYLLYYSILNVQFVAFGTANIINTVEAKLVVLKLAKLYEVHKTCATTSTGLLIGLEDWRSCKVTNLTLQ